MYKLKSIGNILKKAKLNKIRSLLLLPLLLAIAPLTHAQNTQTIAPKEQYIMVTWDDGMRAQDFGPRGAEHADKGKIITLFDLLYADDNRTRRLNPDQSPYRMTYFSTVGQGTNFAVTEYWWAMGNEIANHTVTHGMTSQTPETAVTDFSVERWNREIIDNATILSLWAGVPIKDISGFRAPFLATGKSTDAYKEYVAKNTSNGINYYDSSTTYQVDSKYKPANTLGCTSNVGTLDQLCPPYKDTTSNIWQVPMPALGPKNIDLSRNAMILPTTKDLCTLIKNNTNNKIPIMISLHTAMIVPDPKSLGPDPTDPHKAYNDAKRFYEFIKDPVVACSSHYITINKPYFVTVKEVVDMYAKGNQQKINYVDPKRTLRCKVTSPDNLYSFPLLGNQNNDPVIRVATKKGPIPKDSQNGQCTLVPTDANYGTNCVANTNSHKYIMTCTNVKIDKTPDVYLNGITVNPYIGNPIGSSRAKPSNCSQSNTCWNTYVLPIIQDTN